MIKTLIDKLLGKSAPASKNRFGTRRVVSSADHGISPDLVDDRARQVVRTLQQAGFEAYIVGGAVRDLLLGLRPKDFDVATNATPEQVKGLFRRAFIIGRRFRIVHVVHGRGREHEVIEVSTFRAYLDNASAEAVAGNEKTSRSELAGMHHAVGSSGRVLRDNVWGPQDEDATRRDFTINAMYYDPATQVVVDYHGGIADAKKKLLRMIGDPATRYREDPVRIIRAVRFAAKLSVLGFRLEPKTAAPIVSQRALLADVPQSRLFDEMLKLLQTGHAMASVEQLRHLGLASGIYPLLDLVVQRAEQPFIAAALQDTDRRVGEGKPVAPSFLLACVLWSDVRDSWHRRSGRGQPPFAALQDAVDEVFDARIGDVSGRGKLAADMREIWMMQPRFDKRTGHAPFGLLEQARFRAGFDFLRLRADVGEVDEALSEWWQEFSSTEDARTREDLVDQVRQEQLSKLPKARRVRAEPARPSPDKRAHASDSDGDDAPLRSSQTQALSALPDMSPSFDGEPESATPKRRRRRRRSGGSNALASTEPARSGASDGDDPRPDPG